MPSSPYVITLTGNTGFSDIASQLKRYLRSQNISRILLGVSGGADSVLLYHLVRIVSASMPELFIGISHVNFNLRGEESLRDRIFVERLIDDLPPECEYQFFVNSFDTLEYCRRKRVSIEMGARELRHNLWKELTASCNFQRILTGHHADDNVETFLINLLRGSGLRGLKAMTPDNGKILRPLLSLHRPEIHRFLEEIKATFITDSTNLISDYRRNFLRNEVLPLLQTKWPGANESIAKSISLLQDEHRIVDESISRIIAAHPHSLPINVIRKFASPSTLIQRWTERHGLGAAAASEIATAIANNHLDGQHWIAHNSPISGIILTPMELRIETGVSPECTEWNIEKISSIDDAIRKKIFSSSSDEAFLPLPPEEYYWRTPQKSDRIRLFPKTDSEGRQRRETKLLSDVLKESRVPAEARKTIRLLCSRQDDEIVWIPGVRRAGSHLISEDSKVVWHFFKSLFKNEC